MRSIEDRKGAVGSAGVALGVGAGVGVGVGVDVDVAEWLRTGLGDTVVWLETVAPGTATAGPGAREAQAGQATSSSAATAARTLGCTP